MLRKRKKHPIISIVETDNTPANTNMAVYKNEGANTCPYPWNANKCI